MENVLALPVNKSLTSSSFSTGVDTRADLSEGPSISSERIGHAMRVLGLILHLREGRVNWRRLPFLLQQVIGERLDGA